MTEKYSLSKFPCDFPFSVKEGEKEEKEKEEGKRIWRIKKKETKKRAGKIEKKIKTRVHTKT